MKNINKNKLGTNKIETPTLESIAEAWVRLSLFNIRQRKQPPTQYQNKNYAYKTN